MSATKSTPDERFLIKLFEIASRNGDPFTPVDLRIVAKEIGQKESATKNIIKMLAQANFLKRESENMVYLTQRGYDFVKANH